MIELGDNVTFKVKGEHDQHGRVTGKTFGRVHIFTILTDAGEYVQNVAGDDVRKAQ